MLYEITLTCNEVSEVLTLNPDNWSKMGGAFVRSPIYHGFIRFEFKGSLRFPIKSGGGGQYILDAVEDGGLEAIISINIKRRNPNTWAYDSWYSGILDIKPNTFIHNVYNGFVECPVIDSQKQNKFMVRDTINYDVFSLVSTDNITVPDFNTPYEEIGYKPIDIYATANTTAETDKQGSLTPLVDFATLPFTAITVPKNEIGNRFSMESGEEELVIYTNNTGSDTNIRLSDIEFTSNLELEFTDVGSAPTPARLTYIMCYQVKDETGFITETYIIDYYSTSDNPVGLTAIIDTLQYDLGGYYTPNSQITFDTSTETPPKSISLSHTNHSLNTYIKVFRGTLLSSSGEFNKGNINITIPDGHYLELKGLLYKSGYDYDLTMTYDISHSISFNITEITLGQEESTVKGLFAHEAMTRLIQLATSETNRQKLYKSPVTGGINSEFTAEQTNGRAKNHFVTNGKLIRQYPDEPLNLNIRDLFLSLHGLENVGMAYNPATEQFYIDDKERFYNTSFLFDLGEVADLKITPLEKAYFSRVLSGAADKLEYEEVNGANEYNLKCEHTLSIPIKENYDITTTYRTDSIPQELARRKQYFDYASEDTKYDDLVFINDTDGAEVKQNGTSVTGFEGIESYYNIRFAPRNCVLRHTDFITPQLWRSPNQFIKFVNNEKNVNIQYTSENDDSVNETTDIKKAEFKARMFNPEMAEFNVPVSNDILAALNIDPHGLITFSHIGVNYAMFLESLESEDYSKGGKWKGVLVDYDTVVSEAAYWENGNIIIFENGNEKLWE